LREPEKIHKNEARSSFRFHNVQRSTKAKHDDEEKTTSATHEHKTNNKLENEKVGAGDAKERQKRCCFD